MIKFIVVTVVFAIILLLLVEYYVKKIHKLEEEIRNLLSNVKQYKELKDYYQHESFMIEFECEVKLKSVKLMEKIPKYIPNKKVRVILADYNQVTASYTNAHLESMGIETTIVESGEDVLLTIDKDDRYDIIITNNVFRNKIQGPTLLSKLREIGYDIPVVVLTVDYNKRLEFVDELEFSEYMTKPITEEQIKMVFTKLIPKLKFKKVSAKK